jgi:hypothetical protein
MTATAARKGPRIPAADEADDGIISFGDEPEEPKYDTLFRLGGKEYPVLLNPPASMMIDYFARYRELGPNLAFSWALEQMVGADAFAALRTDRRVSRDGFRQVIDAVMRILLGLEDGAGGPKPSSNGRRRNGSGPSGG